MTGVPLARLVASDLFRDSREALEKILEAPAASGDILKDEPRTLVWRSVLPSGTSAVVKTYRRRSLYDFSRESVTRFRAQREFDALSYLCKKRIPCVRPLAWGCGRNSRSGRFESLATVEEQGVVGLKEYLRSGDADEGWIEPAARLVRRAHDIGFYHGALAPRNILVRMPERGEMACLIIDTPKSIVFRRPVTGTRMADHDLLVFLCEVNNVIGEAAVTAFLACYGMRKIDIPPMAGRVGSYRASRNTRNRMRAEFLLRKIFE